MKRILIWIGITGLIYWLISMEGDGSWTSRIITLVIALITAAITKKLWRYYEIEKEEWQAARSI